MILSMLGTGTIVASIIQMMQVFCVGLGIVGKLIIFMITGLSGVSSVDFGNFLMPTYAIGHAAGDINSQFTDATVNSIRDVVFNRSTFTTASFFYSENFNMGLDDKTDKTINFSNGVASQIFGQVTNFYYIMRNLSIAALLFILLYIGIRMAISTVASEEAKYKKMLGNWAVSMALVFVLQFIMMATLYVNNTLVSILYKFSGNSASTFIDYAQLAEQGLVPVIGLGEAIVFVMTVGMELTFILMYLKRIITLAFLIVIAPLITITYSIDKIGDNKSQALNTWLREFIFTVLIQPFHCIIYIVLIQTVLKAMSGMEGVGMGVIYIIMLKFMKEAEDIIRKIFGIKSDSMPGFKGMGVMALGVMGKLGSAGSKGGSGGGKGGNKYNDMQKVEKRQILPKDWGKKDDAQVAFVKKSDEQKKAQQQWSQDSYSLSSFEQQQQQQQQQAQQQQVQQAKKKSASDKNYADTLTGIVDRMGGTRGLITKGLSLGGKVAGFGFGLGMTGEFDQAIGFSAVAGNQIEKIEDALRYDNELAENIDTIKVKLQTNKR